MLTNCIFITSNFVIHPQILIFSVFKIASFSPYWFQIKFSMSLFFYLFSFVINLWHLKFVTAVFVNNQHSIQWQGHDFDKKKHINALSIHSCTCTWNKIGALKMQFVYIFPYLQNICRKFEFLISRGSVAACLSWVMSRSFVANFIRFPAIEKFQKSVKIWQSYRDLKGGNFFWDTV